MEKQEFIKLIKDNYTQWSVNGRNEEWENLIAYCYDVLCCDKDFARVSEELAATRQDLEIYKSGYSRLLEELSAYKGIVKAQGNLINLRQ